MSAERYDVIVDANQEINDYWIKVKGKADCVVPRRFQTAILRYDETSVALPSGTIDYDSSGPDNPGLVN